MTPAKFVKKAKNYLFVHSISAGLFNSWSDEKFLKMMFKRSMGYEPDLDNPRTFNEKLQWLKLHDRKPLYTTLVDKYEVKKYVADKIGEEYVIPTLGVWDSVDEIDFDSLPEQFVLKCTHDSGGVIICRDKAKLDIAAAKKKLRKRLKVNFYYLGREWPYKNVKPRIIAEKYMENSEEGLHDYKVWCFNGQVEYIQYITGRLSTTYEAFYSRDWEKLPFTYLNPPMDGEAAKPEKLDEIIQIAEELASGIPFVRVDFYVLETGNILFGEETFYPCGGLEKFHPEDMSLKLGDMIRLN